MSQLLENFNIPECVSAEFPNTYPEKDSEPTNKVSASRLQQAHSYAVAYAERAHENAELVRHQNDKLHGVSYCSQYRSRLDGPRDSVTKMHRDVTALAENTVGLHDLLKSLGRS